MREALTLERFASLISELCDIVDNVPVRRLTYKRTFDSIQKVRDQFIADANGRMAPGAKGQGPQGISGS